MMICQFNHNNDPGNDKNLQKSTRITGSNKEYSTFKFYMFAIINNNDNNMAFSQSFHHNHHRHDVRCPSLRSLLFILLLAIIHIVESSPTATMMMMMNGMLPRTSQPLSSSSSSTTVAMFDYDFPIIHPLPKDNNDDHHNHHHHHRRRRFNIRNKRQLSSLLSPIQIRFGRLQMDRRSSTSSINGRQKQSSSSLLNGYLLPSRLQTSNQSTLSSSFTGRLITKLIKNQHSLLHQFTSTLNERLRPKVKLQQSKQSDNITRTAKTIESLATNQTVRLNKTIDKSSRRNDNDPLWYNNDIITLDDYDQNDQTTVSGSISDHLSSPTLNVIDDGLNNTKIAHNILIVHKNSKQQSNTKNDKPMTTKFSIQTYGDPNRLSPPFMIDELEFVPIKNNHRPSTMMSLAQWKQKHQQQQNKLSTKPMVVVTSSPIPSKPLKPLENQDDDDDNQMPTSYAASSSLFPSTHVPQISSSSSSFITTTSTSVTNKSFDNRRSTVTNGRIPLATTKAQFISTNLPSMMITTTTIANLTTETAQQFLSTTMRPQHDGNEQVATWSVHSDDYHGQLITSNPLNMDANSDPSVTLITENPSTTFTMVESGTTMDDNSIEFLKEFKEQLQQYNRTTSNPIDLYNGPNNNYDNDEMALEKQKQNLDDPTIIVFKNNHIKPLRRKPITQKPATSRYTFKPPYATIFNYPTTTAMPSRRTSISFSNIAGYRVKQPEEIKSATLTVIDPPYSASGIIQLPINTTIVHNNILVPMKEGRPKPKFPIRTTTSYPGYPIITGVGGNNWQSQTTSPWFIPSVTTNAPDRFDDEMMAIPSENNYTMIQDDYNLFATTSSPYNMTTMTTLTTEPPSTITKKISKLPIVYTYKPQKLSTTSTTTPTPLYTKRPSLFHAINAPPMPVIRPSASIVQSNHLFFTNMMSRLRKLWTSAIPNQMSGSSFSIVGFLRSTIYSLMVMLLPPIALMTFFT
ncbi:uncharacterized protein LOC124491548 isoform X2 [Dermatophagoides farinae]|uniref:uncharacterized protein LOC124491548 isoform X2 n=1 Tax=Dermatophagoides farinae TaxID=6954 RepID=UPI003F5FCF5F